MDLGRLGLFRMTARRLDWLAQRQEVLAQNIANADTPGYRPNDLVPFDKQLARAGTPRLAPAATQPGHFQGRGGREDTPAAPMRDTYDTADTAPSGNEVVLEQQLMQVTETAMQHQMATGLYRKHLGMIRMAMTRGR